MKSPSEKELGIKEKARRDPSWIVVVLRVTDVPEEKVSAYRVPVIAPGKLNDPSAAVCVSPRDGATTRAPDIGAQVMASRAYPVSPATAAFPDGDAATEHGTALLRTEASLADPSAPPPPHPDTIRDIRTESVTPTNDREPT